MIYLQYSEGCIGSLGCLAYDFLTTLATAHLKQRKQADDLDLPIQIQLIPQNAVKALEIKVAKPFHTFQLMGAKFSSQAREKVLNANETNGQGMMLRQFRRMTLGLT